MSAPSSAAFARARAAFEELVELEPATIAARLEALASDDANAAELVRRWLAADARAAEFLEQPAGERAPELVADWLDGADEGDRPGAAVGPYRLIRILGRGGMGEVWEAERADGQFEQTVAVKLLKRGMDSDEVLRRFRRERQILARLSHPGIARLLDGGIAADGRPYFVLEKVDGVAITEHARSNRLPIAERVGFVVAVAEAVESAHRQLVVHRDLKPSNILVTAAGEVKLLDFGIAKLLGESEEAAEPGTALTALGLRALTPAYAAPEQILGEPVTTATDVYSLGVVLCELLIGRLPHERATGPSTAPALATAVARETPPRLAALVEALDEAAKARLALPEREARQLSRRLSGDLETALARALDRDPHRRYPSMAAFADDLRRYLDGRPLVARRDSRLYRAAKFVRRHRVGAALSTLVALSLVAGLAGTTWQARRAAEAARQSEANAARAEHTKEFLVSLFRVADPFQSGGRTVTARELLDQGARRLESELADEPALKADLLDAVAEIQGGLGLVAEAERSANAALALRSPQETVARAVTEARLGDLALQKGNLETARALLEGAIATLAREGAPPLVLARARSAYGAVLFWQKRNDEVLPLAREVHETFRRELGDEHVETAIQLRNLGSVLDELKRWDEAEAAFRESQAVLERVLGPDHVTLSQSYQNLADVLYDRKRSAEAEPLLERAVAVRRTSLGNDHLLTGQVLQLQAYYLSTAGRLDEAERAGREALAIFRALNPDHYEVGKTLNELARIETRRGRQSAAVATFREALANLERSLGREHPFYWYTTGNLAKAVAAQGRADEAERLAREVLAALERLSGAESADAKWGHETLAETYRRLGRDDEARAPAERARDLASKLSAGT